MHILGTPSQSALEHRRKSLLKATDKGNGLFILLRVIGFGLLMSAWNIGWDLMAKEHLDRTRVTRIAMGCIVAGLIYALLSWIEARNFLRSNKGLPEASSAL